MSLSITVVQTITAPNAVEWAALKSRLAELNPIPSPTYDEATWTATLSLSEAVPNL